MPQASLTERFLTGLRANPGRQVVYWDERLPGFAVQTSFETGKPLSYFVQGRVNGRLVRRKIGRVDLMPLAGARAAAKTALAGFGSGVDPKQARAAGATLRATLDGYLQGNAALKPRSRAAYLDSIHGYLTDWLDRPLAGVTREMVEARHKQIASEVEARDREAQAKRVAEHLRLAKKNERHQPKAAAWHKAEATKDYRPRSGHAVADGTMRTLRLLWNHAADKHPGIGPNPVKLKRQWFKVKRRERLVKADDLPRFYRAVCALENQIAADYIKLLLFTGLRRREAAELKWADVDLAAKIIRVPAASTKSGKKLDLPMSDVVFEMLAARRAMGDSVWLFPSNSKSGHVEEPRFQLQQIARACGVRISAHDLRRTFCTVAESTDISPYALKALIAHSLGNGDVTAGYIKLSTERLREAAQKVADRLVGLCGIGAALAVAAE
jgi:integrase